MNSAFSIALPKSSLAAIGQLSENSRLGFASRNTALHQGIEWPKSTLALGLPEWSGKTASDPVVAANNGFTLGIRAPGQTYSQCLAANSSTYSINNWLPSSAQNGATKFALGNDVSNALFGDANEGTAGLVVGAGVAAAPLGVGTAGTFGRRTASIFNLNLSGTTGPAPTILGKTGAAEVVGWVSGAFELKLAADIGATAAEALNCIGHR